MEKTIVIDGKSIKFKSTGGTVRRYRNQFGSDFFADVIKLSPIMQLKEKGIDTSNLSYDVIKHLNFEVFENIAWTLAKTADNDIPDPDAWFDQFDAFPVMDILPQLQDLIQHSFKGKKK